MDVSSRSKVGAWRILVIALGAAAILDTVVTVEWSFPYCNRQDDWPAYAIYGVIPYERFSGASSLLFDFQPASFAANLVLLWALCGAVAFAVYRFAPSISRRAAVLGIAAAACAGVYVVGVYALRSWSPVPSLSDGRHSGPLRPVGLAVGPRAYACTPSEFWFGPVSPEARAQYCGERGGAGCP